MKYNLGDRVEIVNYGHQIWNSIEGSDKVNVIDLQPQLVGKQATIMESTENQPGYEQYKLDIDGYGSRAWFGLKQLKDAL